MPQIDWEREGTRLQALYGAMSNELGGIRLLVRADDAEEARGLLEGQASETFEVQGVGEYEQPKCPNCGSVDISFEELDRRSRTLVC